MTSIIVPYAPLTPCRELAWNYAKTKITQIVPDCELIVSPIYGNILTYNKAQAIIDATPKATHEVVVIHDADCWCAELPAAIDIVGKDKRMVAMPYQEMRNLTQESTTALYDGVQEPLQWTTRGMTRCGGIVVMHIDILREFPPDTRFCGWGHEDHAWSYAIGSRHEFWLGQGIGWHLWHDSANKNNLNINNNELLKKYKQQYNIK